MKTPPWFSRPNSLLSTLRITVAGSLFIAGMAMALIATKTSSPTNAPTTRAFAFKKGDPDAMPGGNKRAVFGSSEFRGAAYTPALEAFLKRAYPKTDVPGPARVAAWNGWKSLNANSHSAGAWQLIGPSTANVPGVLNALGDGAPSIFGGRVSALALAPNCTQGKCRLYVAAAGGGVWRTDKAFHTNPSQNWQFISGSFGTNAIGSLLLDPNDPSGNTIYAGTGEENASADSEAGVGVYKSTNGGDTWSLVPGSDIFFQRSIGGLALDNSGNLLVCVASGVRGVDSTYGGALSSGATGHPLVSRGLYRQNGASFTQIFVAPGVTRGSTTVKVDPTHPGIIYVNAFGGNFLGPRTSGGIWRSTDNGASFTQIFAPTDSTLNTFLFALERDEFDVTTLPSGATRMYVGAGSGGEAFNPPSPQATFWRSDDVSSAVVAAFASFGGAQVLDYCTGQCWYDNLIYTPAGFPDVVYLGGSFSYDQLGGKSNGRGVLLSTNAGATWSDLTQDSDPEQAEFTHPDQHAIVTLPGNPYFYWEGSDGGIISSDGDFADVSYKCDSRGLNAADTAFCKSLLWRVPRQLANNLNRGFSTLQFHSLSVSPQHPKNLIQGGTQDNGTFQNSGNNSSNLVWNQIIYGDGAQSGFSVTNDALRFNTFFLQFHDANFQNGDPTKWVIISAPIASSPEGSFFAPPIIADPNPANAQTIFQGSFSVWRTQDWGGNQAFLEANCPEFTTPATQPGCGDFVRIGPPGATDLTGAAYGSDRADSAVSVIERRAADTGTVWAATGAGRIFISANSNAAASSVGWTRIDQTAANDPERFPSGIFIDPGNPNHAWVSYSGYNVNTPTTPGHVFEVTWNGTAATFVDRSYNLPDFPITDLVRDDVTGDLYAASDFGVMKLPNGGTTWVVAGSGLPMVEVSGLTIVSSQRILYAATHGRSAWSLALP
jgi:hypothetical protein